MASSTQTPPQGRTSTQARGIAGTENDKKTPAQRRQERLRAAFPTAVAKKQQAADGDTAGSQPPNIGVRDVAGELNRRRAGLAPWALAAGTGAVGVAVTLPSGWWGLVPLAVGLAAAAVLAGIGRRRSRGNPAWRGYALLAGLASGLWQLATAAGLPAVPLAAALGIGTAALGVPWWRHYSAPDPDVTAEQQAALAATTEPAGTTKLTECEAQRIWRQFVATGTLAGSWLTVPTEVPGGWQATVRLPPGQAGYSAVAKPDTRERIASAFGVPAGSVQVHPAQEQQADRAVVTVLTRDVLRDDRVWPGVSLTDGVVTVGVFADSTPARWRLWRPGDGVVHSLISGTYGTGKSYFLMQLYGELVASGRAVVWFADPQEGQSGPELLGNADWSACGEQAVMTMLRAARTVLAKRSTVLAKLRQRALEPTPEFPILSVILDEAPQILTDPALKQEAQRLIADIGKRGRKCGVQLTLITQLPGLEELGSQAVRTMMMGGNVISFRTDSSVAAGQLGLQADPGQIPSDFPDGSTTAGVGYLAGPDNRGGVRMRTYRVTDLDAVAAWRGAVLDAASAEAAAAYGYTGGGQVTDDDSADSAPPASSTAAPHLHAVPTEEALTAVRAVIDAGTPADLPAVMAATGLPMGPVKAALAELSLT